MSSAAALQQTNSPAIQGQSETAPGAARLIDQARQQIRQQDFQGARTSLESAVTIDPQNAQAWSALGSVHARLGVVSQAIEDFRKAVALSPKEPLYYKQCANALMFANRYEEALSVWRQLRVQIPQDTDATANIGMVLAHLMRYSDAVPELEVAVNQHPNDARLSDNLAVAYMNTGNAEKAASAFKKASELDSSPANLNGIAYTMVEGHIALSDALEYATHAMHAVEAQSLQITLDGFADSSVRDMKLLSQVWDTVGWIQFQLRHFPEAENYAKAAWNLSQEAVIGDHLGQIYELEGKRQLAIHADALTIATSVPGLQEVVKRLTRLTGDVNKAAQLVHDARTELGTSRTIQIPRPAGASGDADFLLLFTESSSPSAVKYVSGPDSLKDIGESIRAAKFNVLLPAGDTVQVLRRGMLVCSDKTPKSPCDFVLLTFDVTRRAN